MGMKGVSGEGSLGHGEVKEGAQHRVGGRERGIWRLLPSCSHKAAFPLQQPPKPLPPPGHPALCLATPWST